MTVMKAAPQMMQTKPQFSEDGPKNLKECLEFAARNSARLGFSAGGVEIFRDSVVLGFFSKFPGQKEASFVVSVQHIFCNSSVFLVLHPRSSEAVLLCQSSYEKLKPVDSFGLFFASDAMYRAYSAAEQNSHYDFQPYLLDSIKITNDFAVDKKSISLSAFALGYLPPSPYNAKMTD